MRSNTGMAPISLVDRLLLKGYRANEHAVQLDVASGAFFNSKPYTVGIEINTNKRERSYRLVDMQPVPFPINLLVGDAIQNLRSCLDHLAHHLVSIGMGSPGPFPHVYFPISKEAKEFEPDLLRKVKGARNDAVDAIRAIKPYKGGNETLWRLHALNNVDKHRILLTIGNGYVGRSMLPSERIEAERQFKTTNPGDPIPDYRSHIQQFPIRMVNKGDIILTIPEGEVEENMNLQFTIAFNEPGIVEGVPILLALHKMSSEVFDIVRSFDSASLLV